MRVNYIVYIVFGLLIDHVQWNLDLVTLLVFRKTVTKSRVVTKFIARAYGVSINSKFYVGTKSMIYF